MGAQPGKDVLNIFDGEHDATYAQRVRRSVFALNVGRLWPAEFRQFKAPVAVWRPHHCDAGLNAVEPDNAVNPMSLDLRLALQLQTQFGKESDSGWEVIDNYADVVLRRSVITLLPR